MGKYTIHSVLIATFCLCTLSVYGQNTDLAEHTSGKIKDEIEINKNLKVGAYGIPASHYHLNITALKANVQKLKAIILQNPVLSPPIGFSPYIDFSMEPTG